MILELFGSVEGEHPAHLHSRTAAEGPGDILISLSHVNAGGISKTNVATDDNGTPLDYPALTDIDGYINVHASSSDLATLVAQGNVGSNAQ